MREYMLPCTVVGEFTHKTIVSQLKFYFPSISTIAFGEDSIQIRDDGSTDPVAVEKALARVVGRLASVPPAARPRTLLTSSSGDLVRWADQPDRFPIAAFAAAASALADRLDHAARTTSPGRRAVVGKRTVRQGINLYGSATAALMDALDRFAVDCFVGAFGAEELMIPSLIPADVVDRAGYFETGCQHLSFVAPITNDPDDFEDFLPYLRGNRGAMVTGRDPQLLRYVRTPRDILNPAACLHAYPLFQGEAFADGETAVVTVGGSIFRDESGNLNNAERLYEFRMREIVALGDNTAVDRIHTPLLDLLALTATMFGLGFELTTASDMFFTDGAAAMLFSQAVSNNKIELAVRSATLDRTVATASLNKHGRHFADAFDIRSAAGNNTSSLCLGFGLDRLAYLVGEDRRLDLAGLATMVRQNCDAALKVRS